MPKTPIAGDVTRTVDELRARLEEAEELLRAIRSGEVDALVVSGPHGDQVYTLSGAEHPYRLMVETMSEGALILAPDRTIVYANRSFAAMLDMTLEDVIGFAMDRFVLPGDLLRYDTLIQQRGTGTGRGELTLAAGNGAAVSVHLSISPFASETPHGACVVVTNLTEHKRHQELISAEALERTKRAEAEAGQRRIQAILEGVTDSFFSLDRQWRITAINQRAAAHFERTRADLVDTVLWDVSPPGIIPALDEQYRTAMTERIEVHAEAPSAAAPGNWFERHIYPTEDGLAVYFRDITARKAAEEALRASEERFRRYFDLGLIGMAITSPSRGCVEVNDELCRILGYEREELLRMTWAAMTHPEDLAADMAHFNRVMAGEIDGYSIDKRWIRKDGQVVHTIMAAKCVRRADGVVAFLVGLVLDITNRKLAEDKLRRSEALLSSGQRISHTGSWVWSVVTGDLSWSDEIFRICGVESASFTLTHETARETTHPDDRLDADRAFETAVHDRSVFERQFRILRPDGTVRYVSGVGYPMFDETGALTEYVGTIMDITDQREAESIRDELLRRLVGAQEAERRRIAIEMHDQFGQLLSALVLKLSTLKAQRGRRTNLGRELESVERIARQLDTDLDSIVSRLHPPSLDDLGLVAALRDYIERWSEHFGIHAEFHSSAMEAGGLTDEIDTALYRIGQEALNNVARHAHAMNVAVLLDRRADRVSLIVEDDGVGFDVEQRIASRQRFGLLGMRERATLLRGTLDIESRPGNGTTVAVRVPVPTPRQGQPA